MLTHSANGTYYVAPVPLGQAPVQVINCDWQWPEHNLSSSLFYTNAVVQVVAYQPPPGYALVPMAEVNTVHCSLNMNYRIKCICISGRRMVIRLELSNDQDPHNYDPTVDIQLARAIQPAQCSLVLWSKALYSTYSQQWIKANGRHCKILYRK